LSVKGGYFFFRFNKPEDNAAAAYGLPVDDHFGDAFPDFDYLTMETQP
jgi:hypothetical protein